MSIIGTSRDSGTPWMDDPAFDDLRKDYLPADYRADAAKASVEGWIHIQAEIDHQLDPVAETEWVGSLAEEGSTSGAPSPLACIVYADLRAADLHDVLSRHCRYPLTRGVRQEAWFDPASTRADILRPVAGPRVCAADARTHPRRRLRDRVC